LPPVEQAGGANFKSIADHCKALSQAYLNISGRILLADRNPLIHRQGRPYFVRPICSRAVMGFISFDLAFAEFEQAHGMQNELEPIRPERYRDLTDKSDRVYAFGRMDSPSQGQITMG
jgi:hypothetical protein